MKIKLKELEAIASIGLCNIASLNIYDIEQGIEDYVVAGLNDTTPRRYKIYYTDKGAYFNWGSHRYYLSNFIKI